MAGVGDHPQPTADRPRRRRPTAAVADLHAAGRRDHRPQRPPPADGRRQRRPLRPHGPRRRRRVRPRGLPPCPRRRRAGRRHRDRPLPGAAPRHAAARHLRGAARQQRPDVHAGTRRRRAPGEGERPAVLGRARRQPVRRASARRSAARRRVRPAVRRRRRHVRRLGSPGVLDHCGPPARAPRRRNPAAVAGRDQRGLPLALAPPGAAHDGRLARLPQHAEQRQLRRLRDLRPGGARHVDDRLRHPRRGAGDRRSGRAVGPRRPSRAASAPARRCCSWCGEAGW